MSKESISQEGNNDQLADFKWDDSEDVFATFTDNEKPDETVEQIELVKAVKTAKIKPADADGDEEGDNAPETPKDKAADKKKEKSDEDDAFAEFSDGKEGTKKPVTDAGGDNNPDGDDEDDEDVKLFTSLATDLKDKGVFSNVKFEEGEKLTEDTFFEKLEEEVDSRVEETFNGFFDELKQDPDAIAFIKFKKDGGRTEDFFKTYAQSPVNVLPENLDLDDVKHQKLVAKIYLRDEEDLNEEEIEERIEWLEEKGKLSDKAELWNNKMIKRDAAQKQALVKQQAEAKQAMITNQQKFKADLEKVLNDTDTVGDFKFSATDKKTLVNMITKPDVKVGDNKFTTKFQVKMGEVMKDKQKLLLLAKILNDDFKASDLVTNIQTKVTKKAISTLREATKDKKLSGSGTSGRSRSLADFFE